MCQPANITIYGASCTLHGCRHQGIEQAPSRGRFRLVVSTVTIVSGVTKVMGNWLELRKERT